MSKRDREKVKGAKIKCRSFIVFTHIRHHLFTIFSQLFPFFNAESPCKNTFSTFRCFWSLNQSVLEIILGFAPSSIYMCTYYTYVCVLHRLYEVRWCANFFKPNFRPSYFKQALYWKKIMLSILIWTSLVFFDNGQ